jgi:hypothetical protein
VKALFNDCYQKKYLSELDSRIGSLSNRLLIAGNEMSDQLPLMPKNYCRQKSVLLVVSREF